ncbi:MAG TPA: hypothetical protein P5079_00035 [Elusimicrobiota bacterium]|nr:hypothetical protein [Elusimicrobiota bacterium]
MVKRNTLKAFVVFGLCCGYGPAIGRADGAGELRPEWQIALELSEITATDSATFLHHQSMPWLSVSHTLSPRWNVGAELAYLDPKKEPITGLFTQTGSWSLNYKLSGGYLGPYMEALLQGSRFGASFRCGVGVTYLRQSWEGQGISTQNMSHYDPSLVFSVGGSCRIGSNSHLHVGLKNLIVFQHGEYLTTTGFRGGSPNGPILEKEAVDTPEHLFLPFIGASVRF